MAHGRVCADVSSPVHVSQYPQPASRSSRLPCSTPTAPATIAPGQSDEGDPLDYADAAKVSRRMISKALDQFDGARLQPLVDLIQKAAPNAALVEST